MAQDNVGTDRVRFYVTGGVEDPSVIPTEAFKGTLYIQVGDGGGRLFQKQDDGATTNWNVIAGSSPSTGFWSVAGNTGAGLQLGTLGAADFEFITDSIARGGFLASGARFLRSHGPSYANSEVIELTLVGLTLDDTPTTIFTLTSALQTHWKLNAEVQGRSQDGTSHAAFERKVMARRELAAIERGLVHSAFTDLSDGSMALTWEVGSASELHLRVKGLPGKTMFWTGNIRLQGVKSN